MPCTAVSCFRCGLAAYSSRYCPLEKTVEAHPVAIAAATNRRLTPRTLNTCPRCKLPVTEEHTAGGFTQKLDGKYVHPACFYGMSWRDPNTKVVV